MEDIKKKSGVDADKEIIFSKAVKAGKRIYYLDVKKNRKNELFLAITESKKVVNGEGDSTQVTFEKHKIFLYKEDFEKFTDGLNEALRFIENEKTASHPEGEPLPSDIPDTVVPSSEEIKIDIDF